MATQEKQSASERLLLANAELDAAAKAVRDAEDRYIKARRKVDSAARDFQREYLSEPK